LVEEYLLPSLMLRSHSQEDMLTESLAHFLRNSHELRKTLGSKIWGEGWSDSGDSVIETQGGIGESGRYDLLWKDGESHICIIEAKLWANWGDRQPGKYIEWLFDHYKNLPVSQKVFVLLAPSFRIDDLKKSAQLDGKKWEELADGGDGALLKSLSWSDVRDLLKDVCDKRRNGRIVVYMEEVIEVSNVYEKDYSEKKPKATYPSDASKDITDLMLLVENVKRGLFNENIKTGVISSGSDLGLYYGFNILDDRGKSILLWFGLWTGLWVGYEGDGVQSSPLWLQFVKEDLRGDKSFQPKERKKIWVSPIAVKGNSWESAKDFIVKELMDYKNKS